MFHLPVANSADSDIPWAPVVSSDQQKWACCAPHVPQDQFKFILVKPALSTAAREHSTSQVCSAESKGMFRI